MPTQLQLRRGSTSQNDAFTGAAGEVSVDTTLDNLRLHDASQAGGFVVPGLGTTGQIGLCGNSTPAASTVSIGTPANVIIRTNTHEGNVIIGDATATSSYKLDVRGTANAAILIVFIKSYGAMELSSFRCSCSLWKSYSSWWLVTM